MKSKAVYSYFTDERSEAQRRNRASPDLHWKLQGQNVNTGLLIAKAHIVQVHNVMQGNLWQIKARAAVFQILIYIHDTYSCILSVSFQE